MDIRTNAGYIITDCVHIGENEFVLGVHSKHPDMFVTWEYSKENDSYFWGHYHTDLFAAQKDLNKRCQDCFFMFFICNRKAINLLGEHGWTLNKFI